MLKESWKREGFRDTTGKETYERSAEMIRAGDNGMWMTGRSGEDKEIFILVILIGCKKKKGWGIALYKVYNHKEIIIYGSYHYNLKIM